MIPALQVLKKRFLFLFCKRCLLYLKFFENKTVEKYLNLLKMFKKKLYFLFSYHQQSFIKKILKLKVSIEFQNKTLVIFPGNSKISTAVTPQPAIGKIQYFSIGTAFNPQKPINVQKNEKIHRNTNLFHFLN